MILLLPICTTLCIILIRLLREAIKFILMLHPVMLNSLLICGIMTKIRIILGNMILNLMIMEHFILLKMNLIIWIYMLIMILLEFMPKHRNMFMLK